MPFSASCSGLRCSNRHFDLLLQSRQRRGFHTRGNNGGKSMLRIRILSAIGGALAVGLMAIPAQSSPITGAPIYQMARSDLVQKVYVRRHCHRICYRGVVRHRHGKSYCDSPYGGAQWIMRCYNPATKQMEGGPRCQGHGPYRKCRY